MQVSRQATQADLEAALRGLSHAAFWQFFLSQSWKEYSEAFRPSPFVFLAWRAKEAAVVKSGL